MRPSQNQLRRVAYAARLALSQAYATLSGYPAFHAMLRDLELAPDLQPEIVRGRDHLKVVLGRLSCTFDTPHQLQNLLHPAVLRRVIEDMLEDELTRLTPFTLEELVLQEAV